MVRTRFAPSPTGLVHVGSAYSALLDYAYARRHQGKFIIRIEDTDVKRNVETAEEVIYQGLEWLGIKADESPKVGGPFGPYRQSERLALYKKYALGLVENGGAYYCFCSSSRLDELRRSQKKRGLVPMYDKKCRKINLREAQERVQEKSFVIRLKVPENERIVVPEPLRGEVVFDSNFIDDQVLLKSDGYPTYHLAVVIDDHLMKITHAVRGEEWLSSAPKHFLLYRYFGWKPPLYFHTATLRNADRSKLSKRKGHTSLLWYKEQGYLPEALRNFLCLLGWSHPAEKEIFDLDEFIRYFDLQDLSPVGPIFDLRKLDWMNGEYIRKAPNSKLQTQINQFLGKDYDPKLVGKTIPLIQERITKLSDYLPLAGFFFKVPKMKKDLFEKDARAHLEAALGELEVVKKWQKPEIEAKLQDLVKEKGWKMGDFFMNFRLAIAGSRVTPPITDSVAILERKETLSRLKKAMKHLRQDTPGVS